MAETIRIPVDVFLVTLCIEGFEIREERVNVGREVQTRRRRHRVVRAVAPRHDQDSVAGVFQIVNQIWSQANIEFNRRSINSCRSAAPGNQEEVDQSGFFALANEYPARGAISAIFVDRFASRDLGGEAVEGLGVCIVGSHGNPLTGKVLAHEFGHLLGLQHTDIRVADHYNLMFPALRADDRLTSSQIDAARSSTAIRRVYQEPRSPTSSSPRTSIGP
jgi:Matrixin